MNTTATAFTARSTDDEFLFIAIGARTAEEFEQAMLASKLTGEDPQDPDFTYDKPMQAWAVMTEFGWSFDATSATTGAHPAMLATAIWALENPPAHPCQGCAVQQGTHVPAEAVVQIQEPSRIKPSMSMHATREDYELALAEWKANPKNGYFDGDDDDEDGTPVFQSAEEVIRRSAEVRELRAGDVICIVQLVNDEYANEQHARLTSIDNPDTELAWVFISDGEAKAYYEDKQARKSTALHPKRVENVIFRMNKEGDSQAAETVQAQRDLISKLQSQLEAIGAGGVEPPRKPVQAVEPELVVEMSRKIAELQDQLAAVQQGVQQIKANCYSNDDGDYWRDCPDDGDFVEGLKVGDTFELQASVRSWSETFRVTRAPDETSDDYEVELVSSDAPLATHPTQQGLEQFIEQAGDVHFQRCRVGSATGAIRWDIEFGHYGSEVSGKTLQDAIDAALAAQAKQVGV